MATSATSRLTPERQLVIGFSCVGLLLIIAAVVAIAYFLWRRKSLARKSKTENADIPETPTFDREAPVLMEECPDLAFRKEGGRVSQRPAETTEYACIRA
ncbi:hypothetical protein COCON_G00139680 [Conger conger]|uniref:Uncharacterized protein n=1 Tax=Conger conger TaxID=82655 RepID=A0A9Q1DBD0_CONCO|nr:hypothetical protein COCON_G00139680 [Conger conger]